MPTALPVPPLPARIGRRAAACAALAGALALAGAPAGAATFVLDAAGQTVVGEVRAIDAAHEDTLLDIARRHGLGYEELRAANPGVDPWLPGAGTRIVLPTRFILPDAPHRGLVLNVAEMRLYHFPEPRAGEPPRVETFPIGIGREGWETPLGASRVVQKVRNPAWYPPASIRAEHEEMGDPLPRVVPPGPDNPLGDFALRLGIPGYLIHGTNKPAGIGMRVSHGCVRLYPEDIAALYGEVRAGTPVHIVDQPYKVARAGDRLLLEAHPPGGEFAGAAPGDLTPLVRALVAATGDPGSPAVDWERARQIALSADGIPTEVGAVRAPFVTVAGPGRALPFRRGAGIRLRFTPVLPARAGTASGRGASADAAHARGGVSLRLAGRLGEE